VSEQKAKPAETIRRQPAARLLNVHRQPELETVFPDADWLEISTDRERLRFGQITKPPWAKAIGRDSHGLWVMLEVKGIKQRMRWIAPGQFWMGSPEDEEDRFGWEGPRHEVELTRGFWLFDTPCTQALWEAVMEENPSDFQGSNRPVENVSWEDCQRFINRLNEQFPDLGLRLPTEAQWEYACRGGTPGARYETDLDAIAWYDMNSDDETYDVGQKRPNDWRLYDMLGNVDEWCHDGMRGYEPGLVIDPVGPTDAGAIRVLRGGGWGHPARSVRAALRYARDPSYRRPDFGFRCLSSGVGSVDGTRKLRDQSDADRPGRSISPIATHPLSRGYAPAWASAWGQDGYGPWIAFRLGEVKQSLRWMPPGTFWMGSSADDPERLQNEEPQHQVYLSEGFWLFDTPCTQRLWEAVMGENPSYFKGINRPVENVSWKNCQVFISKVNEQIPGLHLRLPTEAEWEYACRAGTQEPRYDSGLDSIAWYELNSNAETHAVGQKRANTWGLYDMLGNVDEWVQDWYGNYTADSATDPIGPTTGASRVIRGGYWGGPAQVVRAADRYWIAAGDRRRSVGFRCLSSAREPGSGGR
jgi:formylglycine-generating enzyme required for sulfatase activity